MISQGLRSAAHPKAVPAGPYPLLMQYLRDRAGTFVTQVDFYVLPKDGSLTLAQAIGRIAEKAVSKGHRVFIHAADKTEAADIRRGLWTFSTTEFPTQCLA